MGRFFKTTTPQNVDFMYQLPENLMYKASQEISQELTQDQAAIYDINGMLPLNANPNDKQRAAQIVSGYEDKINSLSQQLAENPLEFRKKSSEIIALTRDIHQNYNRGEAAGISDRYSGYIEWIKRQQEAVKGKRVTDTGSINLAMNKYLEEDKQKGMQWDPITKNYNQFKPDDLVATYDIEGELAKNAKEMVAQKISTATAISKDGYIFEEGGTRTVKTMKDLMTDAMMSISLNPQAMEYLNQREHIGALKGWTNENGSLNTKKDSPFFNLAYTIADRFDQNDITDRYKRLKGDPYKLHTFTTKNNMVIDAYTGSVEKTSIAGAKQGSTEPPLTQQENTGRKLQEENKIVLNNAGVRANGLITNNKSLSTDQQNRALALVDNIVNSGIVTPEKIKEISKLTGIQFDELSGALNRISSNNQQLESIQQQRKGFIEQSKQILGLSASTSLNEDDQKKVIDQANILASDPNINSSVNIISETNGDIFTDESEKAMFQAELKGIGEKVKAGQLPPEIIVSENINGKIVNTKMTHKAFQEKLEKLYSTTKGTGNGLLGPNVGLTGVTIDNNTVYKPKKDIMPSRVLEDIPFKDFNGETSSVEKPYRVQYDDNLSIYIDPKSYGNSNTDKILDNHRAQIDIDEAVKEINVYATALIKSARKNNVDYTPPIVSLLGNPNIRYIAPSTEGGAGDVQITFDQPVMTDDGLKKTITGSIKNPKTLAILQEIYNKK